MQKLFLWHDRTCFISSSKESSSVLLQSSNHEIFTLRQCEAHLNYSLTMSSPLISFRDVFNNININNRENNFHCSTWIFLLRQWIYNVKVVVFFSYLEWEKGKNLFEIWSEILNVIDSWLSSFLHLFAMLRRKQIV